MRPVIALAAIAAAAAVIQIFVGANQVGETRNPLGSIVVNAKVQIRCAAIGLSAVHTQAHKLCL